MSIWLRALVFMVVMPGAIGGWLPWYIAGGRPGRAGFGASQASGLAIFVAGWMILLWCMADFIRRGRGTPAPYDPPSALVTSGLFAYLRNPMYVGVVTAIVGVALWYHSGTLVFYAGVVALAFHVRVLMYEEPVLARTFGASYDDYRRNVGRWLPKLGR